MKKYQIIEYKEYLIFITKISLSLNFDKKIFLIFEYSYKWSEFNEEI